MDNERVDRATRHFGQLLRLYPLRYRQTFGAEMTQVFRDMYRARLRHGESMMELWVQTYIDIGVNAMVQSVSSRSKSNQDSVGRAVKYISIAARWLIVLAIWAGVITAFNSQVVVSFYHLLPPNIGGYASESEFTPRDLAYLMDGSIVLCLVPLFMMARKRWQSAVPVVVAGVVSCAVVPLLLNDNAYSESGSLTSSSIYNGIILRSVGVLVGLAVCVWGLLLLRQKRLGWGTVYKTALRYIAPALLIGGTLALERITSYAVFAQPMETLTVNFARIFMHNEAAVLLSLAVVTLGLVIFGMPKKYVVYSMFCLVIVLSALNVFGVTVAHSGYCAQLRSNLLVQYSTPNVPTVTRDNITKDTKAEILRNCDRSYDVFPPASVNH